MGLEEMEWRFRRGGRAYILLTVLPSSVIVLGRDSKGEENDETFLS